MRIGRSGALFRTFVLTGLVHLLAGCDRGPRDPDEQTEGPNYGNAATEVVNEVMGTGGPDTMPGVGAPGNLWRDEAKWNRSAADETE